jgi:hypothetical protein
VVLAAANTVCVPPETRSDALEMLPCYTQLM